MKSRVKDNTEKINKLWWLSLLDFLIPPYAFVFAIIATVLEKKRLQRNKTPLFVGVIYLCISGYFCLFFLGAYGLSEGQGDESSTTLAILILGGLYGSVALVHFVYNFLVYRMLEHRYQTLSLCEMLITREHFTSISQIAEIAGESKNKTQRAIRELIKLNRLGDAQISPSGDEVTFQKSIWAKKKIVCPYCAAELIVNFGQDLICSYCGGSLLVSKEISKK